MFGEHLKDIRCLMELKRYQTRFKHKQRSVAEHSWFVAKAAQGLAMWEKCKFKNTVDIEKVMFLALNHDIIEVYTGDILSTTKNMSDTFHKELDRVEELIYEKTILPTLPTSWRQGYKSIYTELIERNSIESKLVKAGDLLDRVFECMEEIELQNTYVFEDIIRADLKTLYNLKLDSVNYFLKFALNDIGATKYLDEKIQKELATMTFTQVTE